MLEKNKRITDIAIHTLNKNILVSASAGAGKTKLLIDRLIKRITQDKIEVNRILALTFTEAAAFEMKERLRSAIKEILLDQEDAFLEKQLSLIETASISTIHSFCLSVVKDYSYVLSLNPKMVNNLLDEAIKKSYLDECLDSTLKQAIEINDPDFALTVQTLCNRPHQLQPLKDTLINIMKIRSAKVDPYAWDQKIISYYNQVKHFSDLPSPLLKMIKESILVDLKGMWNILHQILKNHSAALEDEIESWENIDKHFEAMEVLINANEFDRYFHLMKQVGTIKTKSLKDYPDYQELREDFNKRLKKQVEFHVPEALLLNDLHLQQPIIRQLLKLTDDLMQAYQTKKQVEQVMDFDDMEKYALKILSSPDFDVPQAYQERFEDVLIDEFQDTSDIQHEIISKVSRSDNVFRVGDIKQSIYQFRNAKPQLMRDLLHNDDQNMVLVLPNNFRSKEDIVKANNYLFDTLMNIDSFEDEYLDDDHVSIGLERQVSEGFPIELDMIDHEITDQKEYQDDEEGNEEDSNNVSFEESKQEALLKARHIAQRIISLNKEGYDFKDICILIRSHSSKTYLKDVFDEVNIPYFIDSRSGFFMSQPIQDVLSFMKVLNDPSDDISFMGLMMSPFFQLCFNDLALVKLNHRTSKQSYYNIFKSAYPHIIDQLEQMVTQIKNESLTQVLNRIYAFNDYYQAHCDTQAKINLDFLLEKAHAIDLQGNHSILYFLDITKNIQDEVSSEAIAISSDADAIKVMTIHQSKGLQFKVVIFWSNSSNRIIDLREKVIVDPDLGLGLHTILLPQRLRRTNLIRKAIEFNMIKGELQEQIRLLYVALTRAESRLICVSMAKYDPIDHPFNQYTIYKRLGNGHWLNTLFVRSKQPFLKYRKYGATLELEKLVDESSKMKDDVLYPLPQKPKAPSKKAHYTPSLQLTPYMSATEFGTLIHHALALLIENQLVFNDHVKAILTDQSMLESITKWTQNPFTKQLKDYQLYSEHPCIMHYQDQYQQIYIDLLALNNQEAMIIDFKSDRVSSETELIERYQDQLESYKFAIRNLYPTHNLSAYIYSLHLNTYIKL